MKTLKACFPRLRLGLGALAGIGLIGCTNPQPTQHAPATDAGMAIPAVSVQKGMTLAALTGNDLGLGGGFLLAAAPSKIQQHLRQQALSAAENAEQSPAKLQQVHDTTSADLNNDGFITLDEVMALVRAGLSDKEIADRLMASGYIFHVTPVQERYLTDRGASQGVVAALHRLSSANAAANPS